MNQILYIQGQKTRKRVDIRKVVSFFAIAFIVYGILLAGGGTYAAIKNNNYVNIIVNSTPKIDYNIESDKIIMQITNKVPMKSIVYRWNGDETITVSGRNQKSISEELVLPIGNNTLDVTVIDTYDRDFDFKKDFTFNIGKDIKKPEIDIVVTGNHIKLTVIDNMGLNYITYRWNNEEELKLEPEGVEKAKIETELDVLLGRNDLIISAVDTSNNVVTRTETFEGKVKPTIDIVVDGDSYLITAAHEKGVKQVDYIFNGQSYSVQSLAVPQIQFRQKLEEGSDNVISVKAYSIEDAEATKEGYYPYMKQ